MSGKQEEEKLDRVEERIEELKEQKGKLKAFLARLQADKEELKELLAPWMSASRSWMTEERGTQVSYLVRIDEDGDIVDHRLAKLQTGEYVQDELRDWADLNLSIGTDPFLSYSRLKDAAVSGARSELDYIEREIESNQDYRDALTGEVAV